jgi:hypothetical protein
MTEPLHPAASRNLPSFITAPSETDVLMVVMGAVLALAVARANEVSSSEEPP